MDGPRPPVSTATWPVSSQLSLAAPEKPSQIYIRDYPQRALAIVSGSHALVFRYSAAANEDRGRQGTPDGLQAKCMVEFTRNTKQILADYRPLTPRPVFGTLGLVAVGADVFLSVITHAARAATVRPGETVERIAIVEFYCLNTSEYDDIVMVDAFDGDLDGAMRQNFSQRETLVEHPCQELRKLLSNGTFYYSTDFDLTNRLQDRSVVNLPVALFMVPVFPCVANTVIQTHLQHVVRH
jgi:synaptojanin